MPNHHIWMQFVRALDVLPCWIMLKRMVQIQGHKSVANRASHICVQLNFSVKPPPGNLYSDPSRVALFGGVLKHRFNQPIESELRITMHKELFARQLHGNSLIGTASERRQSSYQPLICSANDAFHTVVQSFHSKKTSLSYSRELRGGIVNSTHSRFVMLYSAC